MDSKYEQQKQMKRERYHRLKESGICPKCGSFPLFDGKALCETCHTKELSRLRRRNRCRVENGLCARCGKSMDKNGTECIKCTRRSVERLIPYRRYLQDQCSIEGCDFKYCDVHHIDGDRSNNDPSNLATLCPNHHRLTHIGRLDLK